MSKNFVAFNIKNLYQKLLSLHFSLFQSKKKKFEKMLVPNISQLPNPQDPPFSHPKNNLHPLSPIYP